MRRATAPAIIVPTVARGKSEEPNPGRLGATGLGSWWIFTGGCNPWVVETGL